MDVAAGYSHLLSSPPHTCFQACSLIFPALTKVAYVLGVWLVPSSPSFLGSPRSVVLSFVGLDLQSVPVREDFKTFSVSFFEGRSPVTFFDACPYPVARGSSYYPVFP